jgi:hypothetical protein
MTTRRVEALLVVLLLSVFVAANAAVACDDAAAVPAARGKAVVDESQVYYGNAARFKKAGEISCDSVFREIPEYKKIIAEGLTEGVKYEFLLLRANRKFRAALKTVARADGFDLIAEVGAVRIEGKSVPEITSKVIAALSK